MYSTQHVMHGAAYAMCVPQTGAHAWSSYMFEVGLASKFNIAYICCKAGRAGCVFAVCQQDWVKKMQECSVKSYLASIDMSHNPNVSVGVQRHFPRSCTTQTAVSSIDTRVLLDFVVWQCQRRTHSRAAALTRNLLVNRHLGLGFWLCKQFCRAVPEISKSVEQQFGLCYKLYNRTRSRACVCLSPTNDRGAGY